MFARPVAALAVLALSAPALAPRARTQVRAGAPAAPAVQQSPVPVTADRGALAPRIANYSIDARLDPSTRTIAGEQVLTWRNASAHATSTLQFHLYYNAWRDTSSTWMREQRLGDDRAPPRLPDAAFGWIDVHTLSITRPETDAADLTSRIRFIAPDDGNADDRTVIEVTLDEPVQPGQTVAIRAAWSARVPRPFARTGAIGNYYFVAQWFPKIGVLEDSGWSCRQFHAVTEFFADFGTYDVRLTVPRGWVVGATGVERERREGPDGTTTHRYVQEDVHDFAWTASPDYVELTESFSHPTLPPVRMRLLLQPEHRGQEGRHFAATRAVLSRYGEWFGPYPYGHITIVDPAWQSGAGGMEYPTLFTAGTRWLAPLGGVQPESVTIHETGHQFWYGIVATNEVEHAWMDEGINTFLASRVLAQAFEQRFAVTRYFGDFVPWVFRDLPISRDRETRSAALYRAAGAGDAQSLPAWQHSPRTASAVSYHRTVLWLHTLERMLGWDTLQRILAEYFRRGAFRHPEPREFFAVVNEVSRQDLTWFFDEVYGSSRLFDYGVELFRSEPINRQALTGPLYRTTLIVRRYGEGVFPVDVRVVFDNAEEVRWHWDGRNRWQLFEVEKPTRARRADVDPDRRLLLDVNTTNDSAVLEAAGPRAARKWSLVWLVWLQDHLLTYGLFV